MSEDIRNARTILVCKRQGNKSLRRPKRGWEGDIKIFLDRKGIMMMRSGLILGQDWVQWGMGYFCHDGNNPQETT